MWQDTGLNGDAQRIEQLGWMLFLKIFSISIYEEFFERTLFIVILNDTQMTLGVFEIINNLYNKRMLVILHKPDFFLLILLSCLCNN
jgi:hypothetical protein